MDSFGELDPDGDDFDRGMFNISEMMRGGIRMKQEELDNLKEDIPFLKDGKNLDKLLKMLYNEFGQSELADRMSDAFTERQKDSRVIQAADKVRKSMGKPPINVTNRNVIPPKNMDFDD